MPYVVFNPNDIAATYRLFETDTDAADYYDLLHAKNQNVLAARIIPRDYLTPRQTVLVAVPLDTNVEEASDKQPQKDHEQWEPYEIPGFEYVGSKNRNDCGIVACANVFQKTYSDAKVLCFHHGWSSTRGLPDGFLQVIGDKLGYELQFRKDLSRGRVSDLAANPPKGVYLVYCQDHVMPCINGRLYNLAGCDMRRVEEVWEVRPRPTQDTD